MPLAFRSLSHGTIVFGFFNIKTDLILLENYFFFAEDFCNTIAKAAINESKYVNFDFLVYEIEDPRQIGDLMGAIHGVRFEGFIGEIYRLFPFPTDQKDFKQDPEGFKNRDLVLSILLRYGAPVKIVFEISPQSETVRIGRYLFSREQFHELLRYVWEGGYPKWLNGKRPGYVALMYQALRDSSNPILRWEPFY